MSRGFKNRGFKSGELVHTYSIIAIDKEAGVMGGAVQSHYFSVGGTVIRAEPGAGVIATQAMVNMDYGPRGLELLRGGTPAAGTLACLTGDDDAADIRQAAALDCSGSVAGYTGEKTIAYAGHLAGEGYCAQANMMLNPGVPEAMAEAYESASGRLPERLLAALAAAEGRGGDIRGRQSAAMLIVAVSDKGKVRDNTLIDLRVEDSPEPLAELERLLLIEKAYHHADLGDLAVEKGDIEAAKIEYAMAEALQPQNVELMFWKAVSLLNAGMTHDAVPIFRDVFAAEENWRELLRRLPAAGIAEKNNVQLLFKHLPDSANRQRG